MLLTFHEFRFERISSIIDSLLHVQESEIARSRDRSQKAENRRRLKNAKNMNIEMKMKNVKMKMLNKKEQAFQ
jgi:hypothetical protein